MMISGFQTSNCSKSTVRHHSPVPSAAGLVTPLSERSCEPLAMTWIWSATLSMCSTEGSLALSSLPTLPSSSFKVSDCAFRIAWARSLRPVM
ncbi:hypothetical protein D9M72_578190 [compost metagenome]